jgi:Flp pilus assembly protein TadG
MHATRVVEMDVERRERKGERGIATVAIALLLILFMGMVGLAVDLGRAYIVRTALSTAVDGAALAAARLLPQGQNAANTAATNIFNANFPPGFLGVGALNTNPVFGTTSDGSDLITITVTTTLPTTFMKIAGFDVIHLAASGQATRRVVDMAFVIDRSGSLGGQFPAVQSASKSFIGKFDTVFDRVALLSFSDNTVVETGIVSPGRGFNLSTLQSKINGMSSNGNTATAEGLYQSWDQLRIVPTNNQSGLRVVVLFTDGTPNGFPAAFTGIAGACGTFGCGGATGCTPSGTPKNLTGTLVSDDYPAVTGGGTNTPEVRGLLNTNAASWGTFVAGTDCHWTSGQNFIKTTVNQGIPTIPSQSTHIPGSGSGTITRNFLIYDASLPSQRAMIGTVPFPDHVQNANNAARNIMEGVANAIRADTSGRSRIHIFTLGLGNLLNQGTGSNAETGASMLMRVANDPASPDYQSSQPEGAYFYAGSTAQLDAAFTSIRDRIIRLSQ